MTPDERPGPAPEAAGRAPRTAREMLALGREFLERKGIVAARLEAEILVAHACGTDRLALFLDLAKRAGMGGIQEWLSFYFKSPQTAPGLYPEHNLFIQQMKLKNTLRHLMGEELITHLGLEYYE